MVAADAARVDKPFPGLFREIRSTCICVPVVALLLIAFFFQGCDSGIDTAINVVEPVEKLSLKLEDGGVFLLSLDANFIQERRVFESLEELHQFVDAIDEQGYVTLNKNLYHRYKHALLPSEIAALDMEGVSVVGDYRYVISETTISKQDLNRPDAPLEIETYHGRDGKTNLNEFVLIAQNMEQLEKLETYNFRDPEMQAIYSQMKEGVSGKIASIDQEFVGPVNTRSFYFATPDGPPTSMAYSHEVGYNVWNQSVGVWSKKALAYTSISYRPEGTNIWYNYLYGNYGQDLPSSNHIVRATADGGKGQETCEESYECRASAGRKSGVGATSRHWGGTRLELPLPGSYWYIFDLEAYYLQ